MKLNYSQPIGSLKVLTAHRDFADFCAHCFRDIRKGDLYVKTDKGISHYRCAKRK